MLCDIESESSKRKMICIESKRSWVHPSATEGEPRLCVSNHDVTPRTSYVDILSTQLVDDCLHKAMDEKGVNSSNKFAVDSNFKSFI